MIATMVGGASGVAVAFGRFALGGWLFILSGILDTLDGKLARARVSVTPAGRRLRLAARSLRGRRGPVRARDLLPEQLGADPALAAIFGTSMVPYVRAKAESFGVAMKDGLMQRPERVITLGVAVMLSPIVEALLPVSHVHPTQRLASIGIVLLAVTSNATAVGRIARLLAALRDRDRATAAAAVAPGSRARRPPRGAWSEPESQRHDELRGALGLAHPEGLEGGADRKSPGMGMNAPRPVAPHTLTDLNSSGGLGVRSSGLGRTSDSSHRCVCDRNDRDSALPDSRIATTTADPKSMSCLRVPAEGGRMIFRG